MDVVSTHYHFNENVLQQAYKKKFIIFGPESEGNQGNLKKSVESARRLGKPGWWQNFTLTGITMFNTTLVKNNTI